MSSAATVTAKLLFIGLGATIIARFLQLIVAEPATLAGPTFVPRLTRIGSSSCLEPWPPFLCLFLPLPIIGLQARTILNHETTVNPNTTKRTKATLQTKI